LVHPNDNRRASGLGVNGVEAPRTSKTALRSMRALYTQEGEEVKGGTKKALSAISFWLLATTDKQQLAFSYWLLAKTEQR